MNEKASDCETELFYFCHEGIFLHEEVADKLVHVLVKAFKKITVFLNSWVAVIKDVSITKLYI